MAKKGKGIEVSPKYGLNPTLATCFWCGKETGDLALLGRIRSRKGAHDDKEAPHTACLGLAPCDACKRKFAKGVHVIEVSDDGSRFGGNEAFALKDGSGAVHWPTGRFVVVREGVIKDRKAGQPVLCGKKTMDWILRSVEGSGDAKSDDTKGGAE